MATGSSLIIQIQLAIVGVIIVMGVFFIWRAVSSLDDRVKKVERVIMSGEDRSCSFSQKGVDYSTMVNVGNDEDVFEEANVYAAEQMMKVFEDMSFPTGAVIITSDISSGEEEVTSKLHIQEIEEIEESTTAPPLLRVANAVDVSSLDESPSEADTDVGNPLSKTKLKAMKPEKLKDICRERGLLTEGTKAVLIDRIMGLSRD